MIHWSCPSCGEQLEAPDALSGDGIECPVCTASVLVPVPMVAPAAISVFDIEPRALRRQMPERPSVDVHIPVHPRRIAVGFAAALGMAATFMPWVHAPVLGAVSGTGGDGWISFVIFLIIAMLTFSVRIFDQPGVAAEFRRDLGTPRRVTISLLGLLALAIGIIKLVQVHHIIADMRDGGGSIAGLMATATRPGFGLYILSLCGAIVLATAGAGLRLTGAGLLGLIGGIGLLVIGIFVALGGIEYYREDFNLDGPALMQFLIQLVIVGGGITVVILVTFATCRFIPEWWRRMEASYAAKLAREAEDERMREQVARSLGRLDRPPDDRHRGS